MGARLESARGVRALVGVHPDDNHDRVPLARRPGARTADDTPTSSAEAPDTPLLSQTTAWASDRLDQPRDSQPEGGRRFTSQTGRRPSWDARSTSPTSCHPYKSAIQGQAEQASAILRPQERRRGRAQVGLIRQPASAQLAEDQHVTGSETLHQPELASRRSAWSGSRARRSAARCRVRDSVAQSECSIRSRTPSE